MPKLRDLAKVIRSKNAGPLYLTIDVLFDDRNKYELVKKSKAINQASIANLYKVPESQLKIIEFDAALAIKITIARKLQDEIGESDVYGTQQHVPISELKIAEEDIKEV